MENANFIVGTLTDLITGTATLPTWVENATHVPRTTSPIRAADKFPEHPWPRATSVVKACLVSKPLLHTQSSWVWRCCHRTVPLSWELLLCTHSCSTPWSHGPLLRTLVDHCFKTVPREQSWEGLWPQESQEQTLWESHRRNSEGQRLKENNHGHDGAKPITTALPKQGININ
jgi:hypothetical protein